MTETLLPTVSLEYLILYIAVFPSLFVIQKSYIAQLFAIIINSSFLLSFIIVK